MAPRDDRSALVRRLAADAGVALDDEQVADVLSIADDIRAAYERLSTADGAAVEAAGRLSTDPYGALLHVYDDPRSSGGGGRLEGLSVAVKDNLAVEGLPMTCGVRAVEYPPSFDALAVRRLLAAGGCIVGKANMDAWAFGPTGEFSERGAVVNPAAEDRIPGGSSSGSAAAVAAGLVDVALGSDTGGSIRIPASCCGVVGVKPTHGLVPKHGFVELAPSTDTVGPLARTVETAAAVLAVLAGPSPLDRSTAPVDGDALRSQYASDGALTIGVLQPFFDRTDEAVNAVVDAVVGRLGERRDIAVETVDVDLSRLEAAYPLLVGTEALRTAADGFAIRGHGPVYSEEWVAAFEDPPLNDHVALRVLPGAVVDAVTGGQSYAAAVTEAARFTRQLRERFETVDVMVTPTLRTVPPPLGTVDASQGMQAIYGNTGPLSLTGLPAVSVPAGEVDGVPVGVQIVSPRFEDGIGLRLGGLVEAVRDGP